MLPCEKFFTSSRQGWAGLWSYKNSASCRWGKQLCLGDDFLLESEQSSPELPVLKGMKLPRRGSRLTLKQTARMMLVVFAPRLVGFRNWKVAWTPILSGRFSYIQGQIKNHFRPAHFQFLETFIKGGKKELEVPQHFAWLCLLKYVSPSASYTNAIFSRFPRLLKGGGTGPASLTLASSQSILSLIYYC